MRRVKSLASTFFITAITSFVWAAAYAGEPPQQPANLANVNCLPVSATEPPCPTPDSTCTAHVVYAVTGQWYNGFTTNVIVTNKGTTAIKGWTLTWTFPGNQDITTAWNGNPTQAGRSVKVADMSYNSVIPAGGSVSFGFQASYSAANGTPTAFYLNGTATK